MLQSQEGSEAVANIQGTENDTSVSLTWDAPTDLGTSAIWGYKIEYAQDSGGSPGSWTVAYSNTTTTLTAATVTGLTNGIDYWFRVTPINYHGASPSVISDTTYSPYGTPFAPASNTATAGDPGEVGLVWDAAAPNGRPVTGYRIRSYNVSTDTWVTHVADTGNTGTSATITGLTDGQTYRFYVAGINLRGTGSERVSSDVTPYDVPLAPASITPTTGNGAVNLSWSAASPNGRPVTGYQIRYYNSDTATSTTVTTDTGSSSTSYDVTGLTNGQNYVFYVAGINERGLGAEVASASVSPSETTFVYWANYGGFSEHQDWAVEPGRYRREPVLHHWGQCPSRRRCQRQLRLLVQLQWNTIGRSNPDGTGANQTFISGANSPTGIELDDNYIYWTNNYGSGLGTTIGRANLDGTGVNQSFITGANGPDGVFVDDSYIYWANYNAGTIGRANLDGTGKNQSFITGINSPNGVFVRDSYIYWASFGGNAIGRANLDGSGVNQTFIIMPGGNQPTDTTTDGTYIYWSSINTASIGRANLDGTGVNQSFITGANSPWGVSIAGGAN